MAFPLLVPVLLGGLKMLLVKLLSVVFVYFIYKLLISYGATLTNWALAQFTSGVNLSQATVQFTGLSAWLAETMMLGQVISLFVSFAVVRFIIGLARD